MTCHVIKSGLQFGIYVYVKSAGRLGVVQLFRIFVIIFALLNVEAPGFISHTYEEYDCCAIWGLGDKVAKITMGARAGSDYAPTATSLTFSPQSHFAFRPGYPHTGWGI